MQQHTNQATTRPKSSQNRVVFVPHEHQQQLQNHPPLFDFNCGHPLKVAFLGNILALILGAINIGIIGYNFGYYKGSYRTTLFHSELTFLVIFAIAFVLTLVVVIVSLMKKDEISRDLHLVQVVCSFISAICGGFAAMILLIQLAQYGRYFVEQYETKVFAGVLGIIEAVLHGLIGLIFYKGVQLTNGDHVHN